MSAKFNLTAQINLRAPSNLKPVVSDIKRQLGSITADVNIRIDNKALKSIDTATNRLTAMNKVLSDVRNNTLSLNNSLRDLSSSLGGVKTAGTSASSGLKSASNSVEKISKDIKVARTEMEEFGKQSALAIRRFAAFSIVTTGIFSLTNAITSAFKAFISFDKELIRLQQVTGAGAVGISALESEVTRLSTSLGVSSESLMNVATTLAQAGLNAAETRTALEALAKTELAPSFENLTKTTEGAIAILRQFGLQASDLEAALGSVNAVSAAFAVESGDIISAIQRTGGVFASASKGVTEGKDALNEFIAVFTSVRQTTRESAETIATGLRTIFTRIQRAKTIEQLKEFGVSLQDLEGKFVGPFEAVKRLSEALNQLDPRDIRFSTIVEELGGFRQIGKVIPLIQQFSVAQQALGVAQKGQNSLTDDQIVAQKSLANQLAKVREQFLALIREVGKSAVFQGFFKIVTGLASGLIGLASAFKPILPILAIMATIKGVSAIGQFATGFFGGLKKGGGAGGSGSNLGANISGAKEKERAEATSRASDAIRSNTDAIKSLTVAVSSLDNTIKSKGSTTLASGGRVYGFNKGGVVPGSGKGDKVPALLEPGEVVMNNNAVNKYGRGNLVRMNKYASGGEIFKKQIPGGLKGMKDTKPIAYDDISKLKINNSGKGSIRGYFFENFVNKEFGVDAPENKFPDIPNLNVKKGLKEKLGLTKSQTGRDFKAAELKYRSGIQPEFDSQYTPENTAVLYAINKNIGGKIQKFKGGSRGGIDWKSLSQGRGKEGARGARDIIEPISTETYLKWAKGIYDEYDADPSLVMAIGPGGLRQPPEIALANKLLTQYAFETGGAGLAIGKRFVRTPKERISDELRPYLVPDPSDPNEFGFFEDDIRKFGRVKALSKAATAKLGRQSALEAAGARNAAYTNAESAISSFKETGKLDADPSIMKYLMESIANPDSLPLEPKELDKLKKKLTKPNLDAFSALVGPDKTPVGVQGQRTKLSEVFGTILETYGGDTSDLEIDNIIRGVGSKIQDKKLGGTIQKFMSGSIGSVQPLNEEILTPQELYEWVQSLGTAQEVRGLAGGNNFIDQKLKGVISTKPATSKEIFTKNFLLGGQSDSYLATVQELLTIADSNKKKPRIFTDEEKANATKVGLVGMLPFGVDQLLYDQIGDKIVAIQMKSLTQDKAIIVDQMRKDIDTVLGKGTQALYGDPGKELDNPTKEALGLGNLEGYMIEAILARAGANPGKLNDRSVDYASGLGSAASLFGIDPNIPTEVKRDVKGGLSKARANFRNYFAKLAFGGKADGPGFEEIKQQIIDKYPEIQFRISKRKRAFGYNLMGALKSKGGLSGDSGLNFQQPGNLKQLQEYSAKLADKLMNPEQLAAGGLLAEPAQSTSSQTQKNFGKVALRTGNRIQATYIKEGEAAAARSGQVIADSVGGGLYAVQSSSATKGYGPKLYDIVMEAATAAGGMLTSDRRTVSDAAKSVWAYYFNNRSDVKKTPLNPENWVSNSRLLDEKLYGPPDTWPSATDPAWILQTGYSKAPSDINNTSLVQRLAGGGSANTVPAMVSNGEAFVPPKVAKKIGYAKLDKMNQADRNGMKGFAGGGISVFNGPGSGTSDSIGPIGLPQGSYVIREKATKALGLNKGGSVGVRKFKRGGRNIIDAKRAQGQILKDVEQAGAVLAEIMGQLPDQIREVLSAKFKGLKDLEPGDILMSGAPAFTENTRGQAAASASAAAIGLQITGKKGGATTETVAHETGHLADFELGGGKAASEIQGTFQFELVAKIKKDMEEAFKKAGENSDRINNYLLLGKELFAEFFAKASPEVRAIITSTTDAKEGMKKLADALGPTGYTYAGLEASDIDPSLSAPTPQATPKPVKPTPTPVKPTTTTTNITDIKSASEAQKRLKELEVQKSSLESSGSKTKDPVQNALIDSQIKSLSSEINSITNSIDTFVNSIDPLNEQINAAAQLEQDAIEERKKAYQDLVQSIRSSVKDFDKLSPEAQARLVRTERDKDKAKFQILGENVGYAAKERRRLETERKKTFGGATSSLEVRESLVEKEKPKQSATIGKAEANAYLEAKAKQLGQSVDQFTKSLVDAAKNNAKLVLDSIEAAKTELKVESIEIAQTLKNLGSSEEDKKVENAIIDTLAKKIQSALPTKTGSESRNLAKELAEKLKSGLTFDEIAASNNELAEVMTKNISIQEAQLIALRNAARDSGASSAIIEASSAGDTVRNLPETTKIGKIIESLGGGFKATTRTLGLLAAASEALRNSFLDSGKKLSSQTQANFAFFENLGKGVAVAGELNIADSVNFVGEKLKGLGGRFESFGKGLQKYSGAIQAGITVYYALGTAIAAAYNAFNQNELTLELDKLGSATSNTELAFKNLEQSGNKTNVAAAKRAMKDEAVAAESLESRSMINLRDSDRSYARTVAGYEPTGAMAGAFGIPQEEEAKKAFLEFTTRQAEQAEKLGQIRLKSVRSSDIEADMKTANDFNDKLNRLEAEKARLSKEGADTAKIAAKEEEIRATARAKAEALYKKSQTFATLIESGKTEDQALATIYSSQAGTEEEKERRIKLVTRTGGTKEEQDQAIAAAKAVAASAAENERRNLALANAYRIVSLQTENLIRTYDRVSAMLERFSQNLNKISESANLTAQSYGGNASVGSIDRTNENILGNMEAYSLEEVRKAASDTGRLAGGGAEGKKLEDQIVAGKLIQESLPGILGNVTGAGGADEVMSQLEDAFRTAGVELPKIVADELRNSLDDQLVGSEGGGSLDELVNSSDILQEVNKQTAAAIKVSQEIQKQYNDALSVAVSMTNEYTKALEQATEYQLQAATIRINSENELAKVLGRETDSTGIEAQENRIGTLASGVIPGGRQSTDANEIFAGLQAAIQDQGNQRQELQRRSDTFQTTETDQAKRAVDEQLKNMSKQNVSINNARKALEELANDSSKAANALKSLEAQQRAASGSVDFLEKVLTSDAEELNSLNKNMESYTKLISGKATAQDVNSLQFRKEAFGGLRDLQGVLPENIMKQMQAKMSRAMLESMPGGKDLLSRSTGALYQVYNPETKQMETKELTMEQSLNMMAEGKDPVQQQYIDAYREATANQAAAADALGRAATDVATTFSDSITSVLNKLQTDLPNILSNAVMIGMTAGTDLEKSEEIKVAFQNNRKAEQEKATLDEQQAQKMGVDYSDFTAISQSYDNVQKANEELARVQAQAAKDAGFESFDEFKKRGGEDFENFIKSDANKKAEARIASATTGFKDTTTRAGLVDPEDTMESIEAYRNTDAYKQAQTRVETTREDLRKARTIVPKSEEDEKTVGSEATPTTPTKTTEEKSDESKKKEDEAANKSWRDAGALIAASFLAALATELPKLFAQGASFGAGSAAGGAAAAGGGGLLARLFGKGKKSPASGTDTGGLPRRSRTAQPTQPLQGPPNPRPTVSTDSSPQAPRSRGRGRSTVFGTLLASAGLAYGASRLLGSNNASADEPNEDIPSSPIEDVTNFATEVGGEGNAIILLLSKIEENTRNCCANSVGTSSQTSEDGASENQKEVTTPETVIAKTTAQAIAQEFSTVESAGETAGSVATDVIGVRAAIQSRSTKPASDVEAASPRRVAANRVNAGLQGLNAGTQALGAAVSLNNALETGNLTDYGYAAAGTLNTAASLGGGRVVGAAGDAISFSANAGRIFSGQSLEEGSLVRDSVSTAADATQVGLQLSPEILKAVSSAAPAVATDSASAAATGGRGLFGLLSKIPGVGAVTKGVGSAAGYIGTRLGVSGLASAAGGALGSVGTGLGFGKPILGASGGIGAGVGKFAALNTAISAVTESLEFLSDPEAYSARKQAMSDAGLQRAQDRTGYGEFALDSAVGALEGFSNPVGKIVEGGYVAKDYLKDRAAASELQLRTERQEIVAQQNITQSRGGGAIGKLSLDEQRKAIEEAQVQSELQVAEKVKASGGSLADFAKIFDTSEESLGATNLEDFITKRQARLKELPQDRIDSRERLKDGTWDWSSNLDPKGFAAAVSQEVEYRLAQLKLPVNTTTAAQPQIQSPAQKTEQVAAAPTPTVTAPTTPGKQFIPVTSETGAKETTEAAPKPVVAVPDDVSFGGKLNEAIAEAEKLPSEKTLESKPSSASTNESDKADEATGKTETTTETVQKPEDSLLSSAIKILSDILVEIKKLALSSSPTTPIPTGSAPAPVKAEGIVNTIPTAVVESIPAPVAPGLIDESTKTISQSDLKTIAPEAFTPMDNARRNALANIPTKERTADQQQRLDVLREKYKNTLSPEKQAKFRENQLRSKGKLRVDEEGSYGKAGLPVGRTPAEEVEFQKILQDKRNKAKPLNPLQQARIDEKKSRREAYLSNFRPEVREKKMTQQEKMERDSLAQQQIEEKQKVEIQNAEKMQQKQAIETDKKVEYTSETLTPSKILQDQNKPEYTSCECDLLSKILAVLEAQNLDSLKSVAVANQTPMSIVDQLKNFATSALGQVGSFLNFKGGGTSASNTPAPSMMDNITNFGKSALNQAGSFFGFGTSTPPTPQMPSNDMRLRRALSDSSEIGRPMTAPIPALAPLPQSGGPVPVPSSTSTSSVPSSIIIDQTSLDGLNNFNKNFDSYVTRLETLEFKPVQHKLDVNVAPLQIQITGAAAFEALDKNMKEVANSIVGSAIGQLEQKIKSSIPDFQTNATTGRSPSKDN